MGRDLEQQDHLDPVEGDGRANLDTLRRIIAEYGSDVSYRIAQAQNNEEPTDELPVDEEVTVTEEIAA